MYFLAADLDPLWCLSVVVVVVFKYSPSPPITTGAQDTGGNRGASDSPPLGPALPRPGRRLLRPGAPGPRRPLAGRLGTQAGAAGEAHGDLSIVWRKPSVLERMELLEWARRCRL